MLSANHILIFELNWLGDILFSFPFLRAIRRTFPEARIACAVVPRYLELLANNPWVDDVYTLSDRRGLSAMGERLAFIRKIKKEAFDACFFLKPSKTKGLMAAFAGIPERVGFAGKGARLTREVQPPAVHLHRADAILKLAEAAGAENPDGTYEYFVSAEDEKKAGEVLARAGGGARRTVAINPGGNWDPKRWPADSFAALAKRILERFGDVEIMITGAKKDIGLAGDIASKIASPRCYTVAGKTGLNDLAALFKRSALVISADSGPLHLASATGTTTIALFGPTSPEITGPRGKGKNIVIHKDVGCDIPCYVEKCAKDYKCMRSITIDEVFKAAEEVLSGGYSSEWPNCM